VYGDQIVRVSVDFADSVICGVAERREVAADDITCGADSVDPARMS